MFQCVCVGELTEKHGEDGRGRRPGTEGREESGVGRVAENLSCEFVVLYIVAVAVNSFGIFDFEGPGRGVPM